jgi:predicted phage gp36 major capsid-like protein
VARYLRGIVAREPDLPERARVMLGVVEDALERAGAMVDEVYDTWAETQDAETRAEIVRALVRG